MAQLESTTPAPDCRTGPKPEANLRMVNSGFYNLYSIFLDFLESQTWRLNYKHESGVLVVTATFLDKVEVGWGGGGGGGGGGGANKVWSPPYPKF